MEVLFRFYIRGFLAFVYSYVFVVSISTKPRILNITHKTLNPKPFNPKA